MNMSRPQSFLPLILGLFLGACGGGAPRSSVEAPLAPRAVDAGCVEGVRAYLRALKLNEKDLPPGFAIPFVSYGEAGDGLLGMATATGRVGPGGHQVYRVNEKNSDGGLTVPTAYVEIAPE
jgi:hypothetical protein